MYYIHFYVPESHQNEVKEAMFRAGAGKIGTYDCCAWQTKGEGHFRPLEDSSPFLGHEGQREKVSEYKVEMVCDDNCIKEVVAALKKTHPYETPAFAVMKLEKF